MITTKQMAVLVWIAEHPATRAHLIPGAYSSGTVASLLSAGLIQSGDAGVFVTDAGKHVLAEQPWP